MTRGSPRPSTSRTETWIILVEFARPETGDPFCISDIEALIGYLDDWQPQGLWSSRRYAVQLRLPARGPDQALQWALAFHRRAVESVGIDPGNMVRAEILTVEEMERSWDEWEPAGHALGAPPAQGLFCTELYTATRSLIAATTPAALTDTLARFVTAVGGRVEPGSRRDQPGAIDVDISIEHGQYRHAIADAFSVTGLVFEQSLPTLVADARHALARLDTVHRRLTGARAEISAGVGEAAPSRPIDSTSPRQRTLALEVGRAFGTVVVAVQGDLDLASCQLLEDTLTALCDDPCNMTVGVDLGEAIVDSDSAVEFIAVACRARRQGTRLIVMEPPPEIDEILRLIEWRDLLEILPRRASLG